MNEGLEVPDNKESTGVRPGTHSRRLVRRMLPSSLMNGLMREGSYGLLTSHYVLLMIYWKHLRCHALSSVPSDRDTHESTYQQRIENRANRFSVTGILAGRQRRYVLQRLLQ